MNRKQFIKRALLGSLGVAVAPQVLAEVSQRSSVQMLGPFKIKLGPDDKLYHPPTLRGMRRPYWKDGELHVFRFEIRQWCKVEVQTGDFENPKWVNPEPWMFGSLDGFHSQRFVTKDGVASQPYAYYLDGKYHPIWPEEMLVEKSKPWAS